MGKKKEVIEQTTFDENNDFLEASMQDENVEVILEVEADEEESEEE